MHTRVLLIEDSRFLREALEKSLTRKGFEVRMAADGEEGLRIAQEEGKFDLIVLDLFLPKLTGYDVLRRLQEDYATNDIPVLVLSGIAKENELRDLMNNGATQCLAKATLDLAAVVASAESCLHLKQRVA
ncbi:MAG TPA: response regulator [Terriglobales bacterium]|jgi:two-component system cell cycle response regulator DivK|nr:response regulator [Terriglobales bacterium]